MVCGNTLSTSKLEQVSGPEYLPGSHFSGKDTWSCVREHDKPFPLELLVQVGYMHTCFNDDDFTSAFVKYSTAFSVVTSSRAATQRNVLQSPRLTKSNANGAKYDLC